MIRWLVTALAVHETIGRRSRRDAEPRDVALLGPDGCCPVCDHPFGDLIHACIA